MRKAFLLIALAASFLTTNLSAQDLDNILASDKIPKFDEYCFIHHVIKKGVHDLSFIVTDCYNGELTAMFPLVVVSGDKPETDNLSIYNSFSPEEVKTVRDYLISLLDTSSNHPKGIIRVYTGPDDLVIRAKDGGSNYTIQYISRGRERASIVFSRELQDWISAFDECLSYIDNQGPLGELIYPKK